jgi:CheY-like chemotaxis protein
MKPVVLYGEDDANDTLLCQRAFERSGVDIDLRTVHDGACIVGWLMGMAEYADRRAFPIPDLIITDSKMPVKGGADVLRWMRTRPEFKHIPVILHYGSVFSQDLGLFRDLGVSECIEKKSGCADLVDCVRRMLPRRQLPQLRQWSIGVRAGLSS